MMIKSSDAEIQKLVRDANLLLQRLDDGGLSLACLKMSMTIDAIEQSSQLKRNRSKTRMHG
ncbi:hypothetical protein D3Y57_04020 (plasmid) [Sphingomonas paeninsulae]|uniref:Uncharacterized protein n=1 Tax=Sphingomonas paeninsulae TaxID=2319844 RepID=A0A494THA2_SPHPE|nr:hypothetical protein [Sphingomonas paeninsulae]AYJ85201.1 hypothetical protein D3Y57_04020 [Sphingomonas paeninsulae]